MKPHLLSGVFALALTLFLAACMGGRQAETGSPAASTTARVYPICTAIDSAAKLLRAHGLDWGEPQQVLRTGSNWYRLEYARDGSGPERVVLVNPANGEAEFPLPR